MTGVHQLLFSNFSVDAAPTGTPIQFLVIAGGGGGGHGKGLGGGGGGGGYRTSYTSSGGV